MRRVSHLGSALLIASAAVLGVTSQAQVQVITAGSSAQFGVFAAAAYAEAKASGFSAFHYTAKSNQCGSTPCAFIHDERNGSGVTIADEPANVWIVWTENNGAPQQIWAYLSVDSTVGVRSYFAVPRAHMELAAEASLPAPSSTNANLNVWNDGSLDTALTSTNAAGVYNAVANVVLNAANTDIRPEDALFATNRALSTLGYRQGTSGVSQFIGFGIESYFTTTANIANPVAFSLSGTDPISSQNLTFTAVTYPVGAAPIAFLVNRNNPNGLGFKNGGSSYTISDLKVHTAHAAGKIFSGAQCDTSLFTGGPTTPAPLNVILREPTSGTMNTTEFSAFNIYDGGTSPDGQSQETSIPGGAPSTTVPPTLGTNNPLYKNCTTVGSVTGKRYRAVGTGDVVNAVKNTSTSSPYSGSGAVFEDQLGYVFFSYEATDGVSNSTVVNYLTLDGVDGIASPLTTTAGQIPKCSTTVSGGGVSSVTNCKAQTTGSGATLHYNSFPHLRDGSYRSWSEYRVIADSGNTAVQNLVTKAQQVVDTTLPDFVPFTPVCRTSSTTPYEPGLDVYREHFNQSSITANDGPVNTTVTCSVTPTSLPYLTLGGGTEAGGDVGGIIKGPFTANPPTPGPTNGTTDSPNTGGHQ